MNNKIKTLNIEEKNVMGYLNDEHNTNYTLRDFPKKIDEEDWNTISKFTYLSENFMEKYKDKLDWFKISIYQRLSEDLIKKHKKKVNWTCISMHQKLSYSFIVKFKDYLDWNTIKEKYNLTYLDTCKRINFENNKITLNI